MSKVPSLISSLSYSVAENDHVPFREVSEDDDDRSLRSSFAFVELHFTLRYHARLIAKQSLRLVAFLLHGTPIWFFKLVRLVAFVVALLPAFLFFAWYYFSCDRVAVPYKDGEGATSRHFLDVYGSKSGGEIPCDGASRDGLSGDDASSKPVIIFLTGGAWIIGYKMWGTFLARALVPFGVIVVVPDYRNFPQVTIREMIQDVDQSIQWVFDNIDHFGGDANRIVLVGQSAGAHLGSCVVLGKALSELDDKHDSHPVWPTTYRANDLRGFIPVSGPYNLVALQDHFHMHGLDRGLISAMFDHNIQSHSPNHLLARLQKAALECPNRSPTVAKSPLSGLLPPFCVIHGTNDATAPYQGSVEFASQLHRAGASLDTISYKGWSHTDPIIEAPMDGDHRFHHDVYNLVKLWTNGKSMGAFDEGLPVCERLCPQKVISIARFVNPF